MRLQTGSNMCIMSYLALSIIIYYVNVLTICVLGGRHPRDDR